MASMDVSESGFQTPATVTKRDRQRTHLFSHLLVNPPYRPPATDTGLHIATGIDPKFNTQIRIMSELRQHIQTSAVSSKRQSFPNQADTKLLDFYRRYSQRFCNPAEWA